MWEQMLLANTSLYVAGTDGKGQALLSSSSSSSPHRGALSLLGWDSLSALGHVLTPQSEPGIPFPKHHWGAQHGLGMGAG